MTQEILRLRSGSVRLNNFVFDKIPLAKKGVPQIEIAISINESGRLSILATELISGNKTWSKIGSVPIVDKPLL